MRNLSVALVTTSCLVFACGGAESQPAVAPQPVASPSPIVVAPAPPPARTAEEQKRAEARTKLEGELAQLEVAQQTELARLTPEIRQSSQALADKAYPTLKVALTAALTAPHRKPESAARDPQRHPLETLELFGIKPNQSVLEYGPGEGWYTELLAPALAKSGKLYVTTTDPNGSREQRSTLYGLRTKYFLDKLPEAYGKVEPLQIDGKAPKLGLDGKLDAVLLIRGAHGMYNNKLLGVWLAEFHQALKPRGVLGIVQHRAAPGGAPDATSKHGYLPEAFVIEQVQAAGFKLASKSELNANAKDTKDYPEGVWSLPPTLREGDKNRDKYLAIGESDRMTLKFIRTELPAAPKN